MARLQSDLQVLCRPELSRAAAEALSLMTIADGCIVGASQWDYECVCQTFDLARRLELVLKGPFVVGGEEIPISHACSMPRPFLTASTTSGHVDALVGFLVVSTMVVFEFCMPGSTAHRASALRCSNVISVMEAELASCFRLSPTPAWKLDVVANSAFAEVMTKVASSIACCHRLWMTGVRHRKTRAGC